MRETILEPAKLHIAAKVNSSSTNVVTTAQAQDSSSQHIENVVAQLDSVSVQPAPAPSVVAMASAPGEDSSNSSDSQQIWQEKELVDSWALLVGKHCNSLFEGTAADHVSQVRPIFLAYK